MNGDCPEKGELLRLTRTLDSHGLGVSAAWLVCHQCGDRHMAHFECFALQLPKTPGDASLWIVAGRNPRVAEVKVHAEGKVIVATSRWDQIPLQFSKVGVVSRAGAAMAVTLSEL